MTRDCPILDSFDLDLTVDQLLIRTSVIVPGFIAIPPSRYFS
jgi:hypothetical protein